jgi:hypothetical protein
MEKMVWYRGRENLGQREARRNRRRKQWPLKGAFSRQNKCERRETTKRAEFKSRTEMK